MKRLSAVLAIVSALVGLPSVAANAQQGMPQLAAQFVQWALSLPTECPFESALDCTIDAKILNPVMDTSGDFCMVGQQGPVWFLAGTFGGTQNEKNGTITRTCTVPEGTKLFFPVINQFAFNTPTCGQDNRDLQTVKALEHFYNVTGIVDTAHNIFATLNGRSLQVTRVESVPFTVANPPANIWGPNACGTGLPIAPGIYSPGITDGFWVQLENLKASLQPYTLHFHAENPTLVQDVTYKLTVTPVSLKNQ